MSGNKKTALIIAFFLLFITISNIHSSLPKHPAQVTLVEDSDYLPLLISDISRAEREIYCALYMFKLEGSNDSTGLIFGAMSDAVSRGVDVNVVLDISDKDDLSTKYNVYTANKLQQAGINVYFDLPDRKLHSKICAIDDISYVGSHNYTYSAMNRNNEVSVRVVSWEISREIKNYILEFIKNGSAY